MIRSLWDLPLIYYMLFQFIVPAATAVVAVAIYRLANSVRD